MKEGTSEKTGKTFLNQLQISNVERRRLRDRIINWTKQNSTILEYKEETNYWGLVDRVK
jgi:hypothetical protein